MKVKLMCEECNHITVFEADKKDFMIVHPIGREHHIAFDLSYKKYYCEQCGNELDINDQVNED